MIKLTFVVRRRADVDVAEFHRYWLEEHGPLVRSLQAPLGFRRYVQVHRLAGSINDSLRASRGAEEPYDGTAEVWWDDIEQFMAHATTAEGRAAAKMLVEDEAKFIDLRGSALWIGEEFEIAGPATMQ
ncbi:MAG: EthD domain-containing protein [Acidimicrobiales bacterium]|nr:EthD domain-containing protein [Acidimicrobiales bacterium]